MRAINHVKKAVAVRLQDQAPLAPVNHHRHLRGVVVVLVMLRKLKIPFELPCLRIESEQRIAVEIVARAPFAAIRWRTIAGGPKGYVCRGIVSPRDPSRCATRFPRVAFPGFISPLARSRHGAKPTFGA